jgi:hypothetical protein
MMSPSSSSKERAKPLLLFLIFCNILFLQCTSFIKKPTTFNPVHAKIQITLRSRTLCGTLNGGKADLPVSDARKRLKVLCLHGYLSSSKYFRLQLRRLVDEASDISEFGNKQIIIVLHSTATVLSDCSHSSFITMPLLRLSISGRPASIWTSEATSN